MVAPGRLADGRQCVVNKDGKVVAGDPQEQTPIEIRFRAVPKSSWQGWMGVLAACAIVGTAAGIAGWRYGQGLLLADLREQMRSAEHPADALLAIDAALQLQGSAPAIVADALLHPDPAVGQAAADGLSTKIQQWQELAPAQGATRLQALAQRLEAIYQELPADNRPHAELLASQILAVVRSQQDRQSPVIESLCERIIAGVPTENPAAVAHSNAPTGGQPTTSSSHPTAKESGLLTPPPPAEASNDSLARSPTPRGTAGVGARFEGAGADPGQQPATVYTLSDFPQDGTRFEGNLDSPGPASTPSPGRLSSHAGDPAAIPSRTAAYTKPLGGPAPASTGSLAVATIQRPVPVHHATGNSKQSPTPDAPPDQPTGTASGAARVVSRIADPPLKRMVIDAAIPLDGIDQLPDTQLVRLLGSVQPKVSQAAALALKARGWPDADLELAFRLAAGTADTRLELLQQIVARDDLNPRQWLLWMAADGQVPVRTAAISLLGTMVDRDVERELRLLLNREPNESVRQVIRRALMGGSR
ncbi:MAG: hypothetical protein D6753_13965 [Planctomycetota bacterium]|nr:MAG: hypothetical protein D6753_13965 [Planctomycetota bacterium]